jgi:hypothetical protein
MKTLISEGSEFCTPIPEDSTRLLQQQVGQWVTWRAGQGSRLMSRHLL